MTLNTVQRSTAPSPVPEEIPQDAEAVVKLISEINAEEIEVIATKMIDLIIKKVEIGFPPKQIVFNEKAKVNELIPLSNEETIECETFADQALPIIVSILENAFALPEGFVTDGCLIEVAGENGLLSQVAEKVPEYKLCLELKRAKILNKLSYLVTKKKKAESYEVGLKVNVEASKEQNKLFFILQNGAETYNTTLEQLMNPEEEL